MEAYAILAKYYDILMKDFDYSGYVKFIKKYLFGEGLDLCCGSGTMTIALSKLNHKMMGVDYSEAMLNVARDKARANFTNILFVKSDVLKFKPQHAVDFVTCVCDGVNYIKPANTAELFRNIASFVKKDGYFIFDISSEYKLTNILANNVFCEDSKKATYIWSNKLNDNTLKMNLAFFEEAENGLYQRIDEQHTQYVHKLETLQNELSEYFDVKVFDGTTYDELKDNSPRILFMCKRK